MSDFFRLFCKIQNYHYLRDSFSSLFFARERLAQKKAEKELKKKEKLQKNYKKAQDNLKKAQKKYEKIKKKGKLSPEDEGKWLEKIEKLTEKVDKAKGKL